MALAQFTGTTLPIGFMSPESKASIIDDALQWIRHEDFKPECSDATTFVAICNLAGLDVPKIDMSRKEKLKKTTDAMNWLRNKEIDPNAVD
jgi:hypothetical protein